MDAMAAYREGTYSVFGRTKTIRPLAAVQRLEDFVAQEDSFDDINAEKVRENLAENGIVNGEVVDSEALKHSPFVSQVMEDVEEDKPLPAPPAIPRPSQAQPRQLHA